MKLLLAEDERELANALTVILNHSRYQVDAVEDGNTALDYALAGTYDGIVLDIMMPGLDGVEVLTRLRAAGIVTPVLLLTAKSQVSDKITGLDAGADDYLAKPFVMGELLARIRAMTRRGGTAYVPDTLTAGDLTLDRSNFVLSGASASVRLSNKEFQLLEVLIQNQGRYLPAEQLMERVWGCDSETENSVVWVYISYLRKKLAGVGAHAAIRVARGRGYTLEAAP